ncbi:MAG: four helix bundle protein [Gemmatimonadaceae bacterium]
MASQVPEVPEGESRDPLQRMRAYRLACELVRESWEDAEKLTHHRTMEKVSAQLYAAVGSIVANLGEGYAHSSGKDRARIFEYALGSTRESIAWFRSAEPVLGADVVARRVEKLDEVRRMLMAIIPRERDRLIRPSKR